MTDAEREKIIAAMAREMARALGDCVNAWIAEAGFEKIYAMNRAIPLARKALAAYRKEYPE